MSARRNFLGLVFAAAMCARPGHAFPYVLQPDETLATVAARMYGSASREKILVDANHLDEKGGIKVVAGMRIDVPAPEVRRAVDGDTWEQLALKWLGDAKRAEALAKANQALAWIPPSMGQMVEIFPVVPYVATESTLLTDVWVRHREDPKWAWELNAFNQREGGEVKPREVILIPLVGVQLTDEGRAAARLSANCDVGDRSALNSQRLAAGELPTLATDLEHGDYVRALVRGSRLLGMGDLTRAQKASVARAMLEGYVALGETREAIAACGTWRENADALTLDPDWVSPKILASCNNR
jgi:hypothetical protein